MNRNTRKRATTDIMIDRSRNQESRTAVSRQGVDLGRRKSLVRGRGRMCTVNCSV